MKWKIAFSLTLWVIIPLSSYYYFSNQWPEYFNGKIYHYNSERTDSDGKKHLFKSTFYFDKNYLYVRRTEYNDQGLPVSITKINGELTKRWDGKFQIKNFLSSQDKGPLSESDRIRYNPFMENDLDELPNVNFKGQEKYIFQVINVNDEYICLYADKRRLPCLLLGSD
ncbi:hypothetical protein [Psychromonas ossibalaenae]|uniref:hypothetical protein n=1 Tax=Psychromonas ossibalaenae TaxID=444922 RepID=UPI00037D6850|nr:hypothetical protein [Psychromonas ossibalaenae]